LAILLPAIRPIAGGNNDRVAGSCFRFMSAAAGHGKHKMHEWGLPHEVQSAGWGISIPAAAPGEVIFEQPRLLAAQGRHVRAEVGK